MKFTIDMSNDYPLTLGPLTRMQQLEQSIYVLVNTVRGEVPCYRDFGVSTDYLHKPINVAKAQYSAAVTAAIERYIPEIQVRRVTFSDEQGESDKLRPILEVVMNE